MNVILYDEPGVHTSLLPLTFTRPVSGLRTGILTIAGKWEKHLEAEVSDFTVPYLRELFPPRSAEDNLVIAGSVLPDEALVAALMKLPPQSALVNDSGMIAARMDGSAELFIDDAVNTKGLKSVFYRHPVKKILKPWDLFLRNGSEIFNDFMLLTSGRKSASLQDPFTRIYHERNLFLEEGARIKASIINAEGGPVYIGRNAEIQEGVMIQGPAAILEGAVISMGAKLRENNTIGPWCKVGGEVKNSIIMGNSNKAHDGYLGNSVVGEWCNLGAATNNSNLKNNYSNIKIWDYGTMNFRDSGQQFCGTFIGDHSKTAIGTQINTGTVIGVSANVFGSGLTPKFIPSFSWGGFMPGIMYDFNKAVDTANKMMKRREKEISVAGAKMLKAVYEQENSSGKKVI